MFNCDMLSMRPQMSEIDVSLAKTASTEHRVKGFHVGRVFFGDDHGLNSR